ncbi:MAG: 4-(cytidine 5'-diphospho)-2-C-methyl-D-erythritol kinase [Micavibrio sp.]
MSQPITNKIFLKRALAPSKINLFLHVTGKLDNGYHMLDSLIVFTDGLADILSVQNADVFSLSVSGPYKDAVAEEDNLVLRTIDGCCKTRPALHIELEKNIPAGAGLGGGSSDAAAMIRLLEELGLTPHDSVAARGGFLAGLGADVPSCYHGKPCRFQGIGEIIGEAPSLPPFSLVLVWPDTHMATKEIFAARTGAFSQDVNLPARFESFGAFTAFLRETRNDLEDAAIALAPVIGMAKGAVGMQDGCALTRMSGSGSAVFGLFEDHGRALEAEKAISAAHPDWMVRAVRIA